MMNRGSLMISTMLMSAIGVGGVGNVWAADVQCLKTPSCEELGYTEVACFQNNGVKCPYGDKYFCVCPTNYKFTCTGENQTGGSGEACNGKYAACSCTSGLMWGDGACGENCPLGSILFNDFTCSDDVVSGKTPIGVVVYKDGKGAGQALALKSIGNYAWGGYGTDISSLPDYTSTSAASQDFASCENSAIIRAQGTSSTYPAVWAAYNYSTEGTNAGDWCLPAAGIFTSYYNNQNVINTGFSRANGTQFTTSTDACSSSEYNSNNAWNAYFYSSYGLISSIKNGLREVRPVIGFCNDAENYVYDVTTDSCVKDGCQIGAIFYSDKTCSMRLKDGKTPIGVVVYVDENGANAQVMALNSVNSATKYKWGGYGTDITDVVTATSNKVAATDFASWENSRVILNTGDSSTYPAAWAASEYSTEGTNAGDWCLPAAGVINSYYNNQDVINVGFSRAGGTAFTTSTYVWSTTERNANQSWRSNFATTYGLTNTSKNTAYEVRPVLEGSFVSEGAEFCSNSYQYTCSGTGYSGGSSDTCNGKFSSCTCADGYSWNGGGCCTSSYKYTCSSGSYVTGGSGTACGGKYTACTCESGYKWENGSCVVGAEFGQCNGYAAQCSIGNTLFSDGTCSAYSVVSGKTAIAVVVYKSDDGKCGQAMALSSIGKYQWDTRPVDLDDITSLTNYRSASAASQDVASCANSAKIRAHGDSSIHPAVWAAYNYSTEGTKVGDWCLPAAGIFTSIYNNTSTLGLGHTIESWSSSEYDYLRAWYSDFTYINASNGLYYTLKVTENKVFPVIEF